MFILLEHNVNVSASKTIGLSVIFLLLSLATMGQSAMPALPTDISPLLIGENIPSAALQNVDSKDVNLKDLVRQKQTILIFYRGGWCPYCNMQLSELQTIEDKIEKAGYQIVAISPDTPTNLKASIDKSKLKYILLSDSKTELIQKVGIAYQAPTPYIETLSKASDNNNHGLLPVPSVFILNKDGKILFEYIGPDFTKRIPAKLLLAAANELKE